MNQKRCNKCKLDKDITEYYKARTSKDGYNTYCKECCKLRVANYCLKPLIKEKINIRKRKYSSTPEFKYRRRQRLKKRYWNDVVYRTKRRETSRLAKNRYRCLNKDVIKERNKKYRNSELGKKAHKRYVSKLTDRYIINYLGLNHIDNIPISLIDAKRLQLQIKRFLKAG